MNSKIFPFFNQSSALKMLNRKESVNQCFANVNHVFCLEVKGTSADFPYPHPPSAQTQPSSYEKPFHATPSKYRTPSPIFV
jgi:hypothetical protein